MLSPVPAGWWHLLPVTPEALTVLPPLEPEPLLQERGNGQLCHMAVPMLKPHDLRVVHPSPWLAVHSLPGGMEMCAASLRGSPVGQESCPAMQGPEMDSDSDSWDLVQNASSVLSRNGVILCDSTDRLPVVPAPSPHCDLVWPPSLLTLAF